jgi:hypothetical protein
MIKSSIFYLHYLIPAIKQTNCSSHLTNNKTFHLKLENLGDNVYLLVTQLTEKKIGNCVCLWKGIRHQK